MFSLEISTTREKQNETKGSKAAASDMIRTFQKNGSTTAHRHRLDNIYSLGIII